MSCRNIRRCHRTFIANMLGSVSRWIHLSTRIYICNPVALSSWFIFSEWHHLLSLCSWILVHIRLPKPSAESMWFREQVLPSRVVVGAFRAEWMLRCRSAIIDPHIPSVLHSSQCKTPSTMSDSNDRSHERTVARLEESTTSPLRQVQKRQRHAPTRKDVVLFVYSLMYNEVQVEGAA